MAVDFFYPAYEVVRNQDRCITCRVCERQCANKVHQYDAELGLMISDESACVNCQRCVSLCPTRALKIVKTDNTFKDNVNYTAQAMTEIYRQAQSGGVLLSAMGNPAPLPVYWDKLLINASQVTNPSIDPLREPMETRVYLGSRPEGIRRDKDGKLIDDTPPHKTFHIFWADFLFTLCVFYCKIHLNNNAGHTARRNINRWCLDYGIEISAYPAQDQRRSIGRRKRHGL